MRNRPQTHKIARRLQALILLMVLLVLGLEVGYFYSSREQTLQSAELSAANLSRSLSQHAEDTFEMAGLALSNLVDAMDAQDTTSVGAKQLLHQVMRNEVAAAPRLRGLFIYDEAGNWVVSSLPDMPTQLNNADRAYFQHHRTSVSSDIFIGPPVRSRSSGEWIITVTRRYDKLDGSFGGVVLASLSAKYFADFYRRFDVGENGIIALFNLDGTLYARVPYSENIVGANLSASPLFVEQIPRAPAGSYRYTSSIDAVERVSGYQTGSRYPLVVIAARAKDQVLASWWSDVLVRGTTAAIFVLLLAFLGFRLAKQVMRRQEVEADLALLASTDALTGLRNRRAFDEALEKEWGRASREGSTLSLVLIDVDHFKQFNDRYGHQGGDSALQAVAGACGDACRRPGDVAARYGGEELALIMPTTDAAGARVVAERARRAVEALGLPHEDSQYGVVTVSLGCATLRPPGDNSMSAAAIVRLADRALYEAKMKGRNRAAVASPIAQVSHNFAAAARA